MKYNQTDQDFIRLTLDYSNRALGTTGGNPHVACIIVRDGAIIAAECTAKGGRPHAEIKALEKIQYKAQNATIYISLEPCCKKKSPSTPSTPSTQNNQSTQNNRSAQNNRITCIEAIVKAKPNKVVYPVNDPNPNIDGNSYQILKDAGIEVVVGIEKKRAEQQYAGFFSRMTKYKPLTILKIAISKDKKIAKLNQKTKISNPKMDKITHLMRAYCDAILIGSQTMIVDNPKLTCRIKGLEELSPSKYVIDSNIKIKPNQNIFENLNEKKVNLFVAKDKFEKHQNTSIEKYLPKVRFIPIDCQENSNYLKIEQIIEQINLDKINTLMIEGGQTIASQMLKADLIDEIHLVRSEKIIGENAIEPINYDDIDNVIAENFKQVENRKVDDNIYQIYLNKNSNRTKSCLPV